MLWPAIPRAARAGSVLRTTARGSVRPSRRRRRPFDGARPSAQELGGAAGIPGQVREEPQERSRQADGERPSARPADQGRARPDVCRRRLLLCRASGQRMTETPSIRHSCAPGSGSASTSRPTTSGTPATASPQLPAQASPTSRSGSGTRPAQPRNAPCTPSRAGHPDRCRPLGLGSRRRRLAPSWAPVMWAPVANRVEFLDSGGMSKDGKDLSALEEQFDKAFLRNLGQIWTSGVFLWLATLFWNSVGRIPKPTPRGLGPLLDAWQWTIGPDEQSCWAILLGAAAFVGTLSVAVVAAAWRPSQLEEPVELIVFRWARAMEVAQLSGSSIAVAAAVYGTARTPSLGPVFLLTALVIGLVAAATRSHDGAIGVRLAHVRAQRRYAGCERRLQILRATAPPGALSLRPSRRSPWPG